MGMSVFRCGTSLAHDALVLIRRCAWHREYFGYPMVFGITSWGELRLSFTDGMCLRCTARFRRQWQLPGLEARRLDLGSASSWARAALVVVFVVASVTLVTRQSGDLRPSQTLTAPPETVLVPPVPADDVPAQAVASPQRRAASRVVNVTPVNPPRPASLTRARATERAEPVTVIPSTVAIEPIAVDPAPVPIARAPIVFAAVPHAGLTQQAP